MSFDPDNFDWHEGLLAGWTYEKPVNKWFQGQFRHAHRLTRQCPTCTETIILDVTEKAIRGDATNHGMSLRRCKDCRKALKTGPDSYASRKEVGATRRAALPEEVIENQKLKKQIAAKEVMAPDDYDEIKKQRDEAWEVNLESAEMIADLKKRLAQYELTSALKDTVKALPWEPTK